MSDLLSVVKILKDAFPDTYQFRGLEDSKIKRVLYFQFKYGKFSIINRSLRFFIANTYERLQRGTFQPLLCNQAVFVAEEGSKNEVVAVAIVDPIARDVWSLSQIAVLRNYRKRGIGSKLIKNVISHVRSKGGKEIQLRVKTNNAGAMKLYSKLGFAIGKKQLILMTIDL